MNTTLYKRNAKGDIIQWTIFKFNNCIHITHGIMSKSLIDDTIVTNRNLDAEIESRIKAKRKEGYKALEDVYDNAPKTVANDLPRKENGVIEEKYLYSYLQTYLPKYNTTNEGFVLPMLAKTLEDNKPFEKYGDMLGQWKINGLRCLIGAEKTIGDLFSSVKLTYTSREGTKWNLSWMDSEILKVLDKTILDLLLEEGAYLDGELYIPGYNVNDINSFVKNDTLPQHYKLQYWCYDIAIEGYSAIARNNLRLEHINSTTPTISNKYAHLNLTNRFTLLPTTIVQNIDEARTARDEMINLGFEGLILRNPEAEYAFGKRNMSMFKFKKKEDGIFDIVGIKEDKRGLPIYVLKNDINDELFECTLNAPQDVQKSHIQIKDMLIGKQGLVEYRERSGVKQVPFHAKLIKVVL